MTSLHQPLHPFTFLKHYRLANQHHDPIFSDSDCQSSLRPWLLGNLGLVPYSLAWKLQKLLVREKISHPDWLDILLLLEHPSVYTLGTGANLKFLKFDPQETGWEVHRIERGGEVTYHCPGQLVAYPLLNLRYYQTDLHWYLRQLETAIIQLLATYDLEGYRIRGLTGVWLEGYKIAAIGIKVSRWITMHGLAINVCPDLEGFQYITPCGIEDKPVGSLTQFLPGLDVARVKRDLIQVLTRVFQVELVLPSSIKSTCPRY